MRAPFDHGAMLAKNLASHNTTYILLPCYIPSELQIPVFVVLIPLLINLGALFDYRLGPIPVNGKHCLLPHRPYSSAATFLDSTS